MALYINENLKHRFYCYVYSIMSCKVVMPPVDLMMLSRFNILIQHSVSDPLSSPNPVQWYRKPDVVLQSGTRFTADHMHSYSIAALDRENAKPLEEPALYSMVTWAIQRPSVNEVRVSVACWLIGFQDGFCLHR